jgi:hypothetical protein
MSDKDAFSDADVGVGCDDVSASIGRIAWGSVRDVWAIPHPPGIGIALVAAAPG